MTKTKSIPFNKKHLSLRVQNKYTAIMSKASFIYDTVLSH